jgi:hypothetical protein
MHVERQSFNSAYKFNFKALSPQLQLRGHTPMASQNRFSDVKFLRFEPHQAKHEHDIPQRYLKALPLLKFPTAYSKAL